MFDLAHILLHHLNDDKHSYFLIYMICILRDIWAQFLSSERDKGFSILESSMRSHGLLDVSETLILSPAEYAKFFYHLLNGMCAYSQGAHCRFSLDLSSSEISRRMTLIVNSAPVSVLSGVICQSLGYSMDISCQSYSPYDILDEHRSKLLTFESSSTQECFFRIQCLSSPLELMLLSAVHGLRMLSNIDDMKVVLLHHICYGECFQNYILKVPPACLGVKSEYVHYIDTDPRNFEKIFLCEGIHTLTRDRLFLLLNYYEIPYESQWSLRQLRENAQFMVDNMCKNSDVNSTNIMLNESVSIDNNIVFEWPKILSDSSKSALIQAFKRETSSAMLAKVTCASCGEHVFKNQSCEIPVNKLDLNLFRSQTDNLPMPPPYSSGPYKNLLICPFGVNNHAQFEDSFTICNICESSLRHNHVPSLAFVNNTYLGEIPSELQQLTFVEELMIGLCRAKCTIFQLRENKREGISTISQSAFRGHIIVYPQNPSSVASFLPPNIEEVTSLICILFIGSTKPTLKWLHENAKPLAVRANKIRAALVWLKQNNKLYKDITLDEDVLQSLPEDGILPFYIEHMSSAQEHDSLTCGYGNIRHLGNHDNKKSVDEISFDKLIITDVEGHMTTNDIRIAALNHFRKKSGMFIAIPHGAHPENEFNNSSLFPKMYPTLFPYGVGGFEDDARKYKIS